MRDTLLAGGGLLAALGASTCCVLPLSLTALGTGGAWLGTLTLLAPYATLLQIAAILLLGIGLWLVYAARRVPLDEGVACATTPTRRLTKTMLWLGIIVTAVALTARWWEPLVA